MSLISRTGCCLQATVKVGLHVVKMFFFCAIFVTYLNTILWNFSLRLYLLNYYFYTQISGEPSRSRALPFNLKSSPFIFPLHSPLSDSLPCFPRDFLFYTGFHSSTCSPHLSSARRADSEYFEAKASVSGARKKLGDRVIDWLSDWVRDFSSLWAIAQQRPRRN